MLQAPPVVLRRIISTSFIPFVGLALSACFATNDVQQGNLDEPAPLVGIQGPDAAAAAHDRDAAVAKEPSQQVTPPGEVAGSIAAGAAGDGPSSCPAGMLLVDADYCPTVRRDCRRWLEDPEKFSYARCAEYDANATCLATREHRRFCVDEDEYTKPGESLPANHESWTSAKKICEADGKRLCLETEWQLACEGPEMLPYPYGLVRDATACNFDQSNLYEHDGELRDLREAGDARGNRCASPFGVRNMVGNLDEWVVRDGITYPHKSALKGGWWLSGRNRCRAATTAHDEHYEGVQTGFRCCADAK